MSSLVLNVFRAGKLFPVISCCLLAAFANVELCFLSGPLLEAILYSETLSLVWVAEGTSCHLTHFVSKDHPRCVALHVAEPLKGHSREEKHPFGVFFAIESFTTLPQRLRNQQVFAGCDWGWRQQQDGSIAKKKGEVSTYLGGGCICPLDGAGGAQPPLWVFMCLRTAPWCVHHFRFCNKNWK